MSVSHLNSLRHPPEAVVSFVRRLIDDYRPNVESERRAQPRKAVTIPVVVQPLDSGFQLAGEAFNAVTKDISAGGIGVMHSEQVTTRYLQVQVATQDGEQMSLLAQVKHCTPHGQYYHIGARFVVDWNRWRDNESHSNSSRAESVSDMPASLPVKGQEMRR